MASPYTIVRVEDVAAVTTSNIIEGQTGRSLVAPSRVKIALNRESVDVSYDVFIGSERVMVNGASAINALAGDIPILPDDILIDTFGNQGDEIVINATNVNAAAQEARVIVQVAEVDDASLQACMDQLALSGLSPG